MSAPDPSHDLHDILPGIEVTDFIGRGGMGAVYKARQQSLNRIVAVKLLSAHAAHSSELDFTTRFKVEAQAMARLAHPNIVPVHDFGETGDGHLFYVMEFVDGTDLAKRIECGGKLPLDEVVRIALAVCDALSFAHEHGVVHRDIKPSNILLADHGVVKVADFGLAKIDDPATASLTLSGTSMGSQGYAAPEVFAKASSADHRADIYSLGVLLYEMLTGDVPRGMFKLPSEKIPGLDDRWDELICKALEEDRDERFQSVAEMRAALSAVVTTPSLALSRAGGRVGTKQDALAIRAPAWQIHWRRVAVAGIAASAVVAAAWMNWPRSHSPASAVGEGWQDVLAQIDLTKHRRSGRWKFVNGRLGNGDDASGSVIELPVSAPGASDLRIKMTRHTAGSGAVTLAFHLGARGGQFVILDYSRPRAGLEYIDGKSITTNNVQVEHPAAYLTIGQPHEILLCLRDEGMTASLDGVEIYRWKGDWSRVTQDGSWKPQALIGKNAFAIASRLGRIEIEEIAFRPLTGAEAKKLPPGSPAAPPLPEPRVFAGNGHRYQFVPGQFTWTEAEANAKSMGGHLVTLTSQEENDWVWSTFSPWLPSQLTSSSRTRGWWVGGMLSPEKEWRWVTGEPFEFNRVDKEEKVEARVPRLLQHDNGGGRLSLWRPLHYSSHMGYVVEWDDSSTAAAEDAEARQLAAWVLSLPLSSEPTHEDHKVPDVMVEGSSRNLRKVSELPTAPFAFSRIRIGPLPMDDKAREHLGLLARQTRLYDLRIYAAESAEVLADVRSLTRLGTFVFKAMPGASRPLTDEQLATVGELVNLNSLRLEGWSGMTGSGFSVFKNKRKLSSLSINDCPDLTDAGLAEVAKFTGLETLSLLGAAKITDAGITQLKTLKQLKSLGLGNSPDISAKAIEEIKTALPACTVNR